MSEHTFKLPDIGEGIAEAELTEWLVKVGDIVQEDDAICEVTTDKATVEIPASVGGKVTWLGAEPGETVAIGSDLIRIETYEAVKSDDPGPEEAEKQPDEPADDLAPNKEELEIKKPKPRLGEATKGPAKLPDPAPPSGRARLGTRGPSGKPLAAPSVRGRARSLGIDLRQVAGTGPAGRILHDDLAAFAEQGQDAFRSGTVSRRTGHHELRVTGVRRKIAERMALSKSRIPHFTIVEEVDVEAVEDLRARLNRDFGDDRGKLTLLPFIVRALAEAVRDHPEINAHYDDEAGVITRHDPLHCGIATQTDTGLMVPVLRHAEAQSLWECAREIRRLSEAARAKRAAADELKGSTITVTSLGPLGAIVTTPIINHPEVAIVGINKIAVRPVWNGSAFAPRRMMNLSCSFDHRVVDGYVAAEFVARMKALLEVPATMFMEWRDE